jgi:hypothetical protein
MAIKIMMNRIEKECEVCGKPFVYQIKKGKEYVRGG